MFPAYVPDLSRLKETKYPPRDYQTACAERAVELYEEGYTKQLFSLAMGLGKTVLFSILPSYFPKHFQYGVLVLVHRDVLAFQAAEKLQAIYPNAKIGIEKGKYRASIDCDFVVASVQTLGRRRSANSCPPRLKRFLRRFAIVVVDETHHVKKGGQYAVILNALGLGPNKKQKFAPDLPVPRLLFGVTATPNRNDGVGLGHFYEVISTELDIKWGVKNGWLVKPEILAEKTSVSLDNVTTRAGDFSEGELEETINVEPRNAAIISAYKKLCEGNLEGQKHIPKGQAIAYCAGVQHAKDLAYAFMLSEIPSLSIDGSSSEEDRKFALDAFAEGKIKVLCNCMVYTEGFDAPNCDVILMARPTQSEPLYIQMAGRGDRPLVWLDQETPSERCDAILESDKPYYYIVDFVDNYKSNNLVTGASLVGPNDGYTPSKKKNYAPKEEPYEENEIPEFEGDGSSEGLPTQVPEIGVATELVDPFVEKITASKLKHASNLSWTIMDPHKARIVLKGQNERECIVDLVNNKKGEYSLEVTYSAYIDGEGNWHKEKILKSDAKVKGLDKALSKTDNWILENYPNAAKNAGRKDGNKRATQSQMRALRELGFPTIPGVTLKRKDYYRIREALIREQNEQV